MTPEEASKIIQESVRVTQPEIIAAKQYMLEQKAGAFLDIESLAVCRIACEPLSN